MRADLLTSVAAVVVVGVTKQSNLCINQKFAVYAKHFEF